MQIWTKIKDRNCKDLIEAEEIEKRWQEDTEKLYKKCLNDLDNHHCVVTYLEPDILDSEVNRDLGSITTNKTAKLVKVMEFQLSYFKS